MILVILFMLLLSILRVVGEVVFERAFPKRTLPVAFFLIGITFYALVNL
jgi:hypothetical protein